MIRLILSLILALALPAAAIADDHHGGDQHGGGSRTSGAPVQQYRSAPSTHYSIPQQRGYGAPQQRGYTPQQRVYSAPQYTPQQRNYASPQQRYAPQDRYNSVPEEHYNSVPQERYNSGSQEHYNSGYSGRESAAYERGYSGRSYSTGPFSAHQFNGRVIGNPFHWGGWGWNRGIAWFPGAGYWGGGFWGSWGLDTLAAAVLFGSIIDDQSQVIYPSYAVAPQSPGAELLENYSLQQTQCGPPDLVVIWGPDNSVICAYPNNMVAPGTYELDPETLTITSSSS